MVPSLLLVGKVEAAADWLASKHDTLTVMTVLAAAAGGAFGTDSSATAHSTDQVRHMLHTKSTLLVAVKLALNFAFSCGKVFSVTNWCKHSAG
jgi:hypothetical protein